MFDTKQKLEISGEQLDVIEAALHTQSKILNVQAAAGGIEARDRLNAVKRTLSAITQQKPTEAARPCAARTGWFSFSRITE